MRDGRLSLVLLFVATTVALVAGSPYNIRGPNVRSIRAAVNFVEANGSGVDGFVLLEQTFWDDREEAVVLDGIIGGLAVGKHGFHVHKNGNLTNGCKDAGGHFNPFEATHGAPSDAVRHVGDLGNIETMEGEDATMVRIFDSRISLNSGSTSFIGGRAIVIHGGEDDLGRGGNEGSLKTGNAGPRLACGIIELLPRK